MADYQGSPSAVGRFPHPIQISWRLHEDLESIPSQGLFCRRI